MECNTFSFYVSINWILCTLWPLLVTAINFFEGETAIFSGRSPSGSERPAGDSHQPLGKSMRLLSFELPGDCPKEKLVIKRGKNQSERIFLMYKD